MPAISIPKIIFGRLYIRLKYISRNMLLEIGIPQDEEFNNRVSDMAGDILETLIGQGYSKKQISDAINILEGVERLIR